MNFLIAGMPNVGKTSLYNLITQDKYNIVHKTVNTTRDWHVSNLINNENINIYDTPGVILKTKKDNKINFEDFIDIINIIIYVIDYKNSNYSIDRELINKFRSYNKKIILVVNKDDNYFQDKNLDTLGIKEIFYLSCSHKLGINELLEYINSHKISDNFKTNIDYHIAIYGKTNVGKSTLLNKLVGFKRSIVSNIPKTTTDIVYSKYKYRNKNYSIIDTAGIIKKNKIDKDSLDFYATKKTLSIINNTDISLFLIDVEQGFDSQSKKIFNIIYQKSNIILLLINKIDLLKKNSSSIINELKEKIIRDFSFSNKIYILTISSFNKKDINNTKLKIHQLTSNIKIHIPTSKINFWLKNTTNNNPHSRIKGKEVKFKYATQVSSNPMTIKIFSNYSKEIKNTYRRFLQNNFSDYFKIKSKIIKFIFSKGSNPYN